MIEMQHFIALHSKASCSLKWLERLFKCPPKQHWFLFIFFWKENCFTFRSRELLLVDIRIGFLKLEKQTHQYLSTDFPWSLKYCLLITAKLFQSLCLSILPNITALPHHFKGNQYFSLSPSCNQIKTGRIGDLKYVNTHPALCWARLWGTCPPTLGRKFVVGARGTKASQVSNHDQSWLLKPQLR